MRILFVALCLCSCSVSSNVGFDGGDLSNGPPPAQLCTTSACAQNPCTPGCIFEAPLCPGTLPTLVDTSKVTACPGFCGLFTVANALGCGLYDGSKDGCQACGFRWGNSSCVDVAPMLDYRHAGAICQNSNTCFDGTPPEDMSIPCDSIDGIVRD